LVDEVEVVEIEVSGDDGFVLGYLGFDRSRVI